MLGIYGDDEIENTRFVVELYNNIRHQFEAASFLANVGEKSKESINGVEDLQKTLLSEMGDEVKTKIGSTFKGSSEIKRRLGHKRVLLVLDDVDSIQQLDSLAGGVDWFGPGSRIIITTSYEDVLDKHVLDGVEIKKYCIVSKQVKEVDVEEGDVVGFMNNVSFVIEQLEEADSGSNVVSIIGMGGLGKTTFAQGIYNSNEVKKLFPCRAWIRVSKNYRAREVLLNLLHSLKSSTSRYKNSEEEDLKKNVRNCLKRNKYLVVLDDIWDPEVWDDIKGAFPDDSNGSKILITSRNEMVAKYTSSRTPYYLPFLDEEDSWKLFCKKVFLGEKCPSDLELLGRSIVESCGRLPLAIVALAGLVAKKKRSEREWLRIKEHVHWRLTEDKTKVMDVLKLSYDSLPERLKPCFLILGIYPEDYEIRMRELIQLWIAEGFIQPQENGIPNAPEPEDVGEEYLDELVDRNLVHVVRWRSDGGVKKCLIHDLLRDLCISLSKADKFFEVCTKSNIHTLSNPHRLSFLCNEQSYVSSIKSNQSCIHSLFIFAGKSYSDDTLEKFQSVQVLHLGRQAYFQDVPSNLKAMIFLRYLRIEGTSKIRDVPGCIWSLRNLETLDLRGWRTYDVPSEFWKLERLRHIYMRMDARLPEDKQEVNSKTMWNLQTLCEVYFDPPTAILFSDGSFPHLRKLGLCYDPRMENCCSLDELLWSLHCLTNLRTLKIRCCYSELSLDAFMFPSNLTKITLLVFGNLDFRSINTLGRLPNLQILKLLEGTIPDCLNCAAGEFPHLQMLKMKRVRVQSWRLKKGAMPSLRKLVVWGCSGLGELPEELWSLTTLQEVDVVDPFDELENSLQNVEVNDNCDLTISYTSD